MSKQDQEMQESLVDRVEQLVRILQDSSIGELELSQNGTKIILRRCGYGSPQVPPPQTLPMPPVSSPATREILAPQPQVAAPATVSAKENRSVAIVAPLTGVVYLAPSPDQPSFVKVGDNVQPEQVVALIETMKVFNEIRAEVAGRITHLVAKSGEVVKKGNVLFRVDPL